MPPHDLADGPGLRSYERSVPPNLERVTQHCAQATMLVGLAVLAGWVLGIEGLKSVLPGLATMKANTALCFTLAGAALAFRGRPRARLACAGAVLVLSGLTLVQEMTEADLGIDQLLFRDTPGAAQTVAPGRMSPATGVSFVLSGGALLLMGAPQAAMRRAGEALALASGTIGAIALLGYAYGVEQLYRLPGFTSMALHTSAVFLVLAAGILCARPDGIAGVFASPGVGGQLARRLLPLALLIPAVLGWMQLLGQRTDWIGPEQGMALFASTMILALVALIWHTALSLEAADADRTRAGQALEESRARLAGIVESALNAVITVDAGQRIVLFNPAAERMFGCTEAEAIGSPIDRFIPARFGEAHSRHIADFSRSGETNRALGRLGPISALRSGGEEFPIEASVSQVEIGGRRLFTIILRDITERLRAERALLESQQDLSHAQAVAHTGSWRMDVRRNELLWSEENHRIFGIPKGTPMTYESFLAIVHPDDREYVRRQWSAALAGAPYDIEHRIVVGESVKWVRERAHLEFDQEGVLLGGFGTTQDITERKQAEVALRESAERLQTLSRRLLEIQEAERRAIARELHDEIGQVLTAVKINLQSAERRPHKGPSAPDLKDSVEIVEDAIQWVRNRSLDLRPALLDDLGLIPTIRWFLERHASRAGFVAEFVAEPLVTRPPTEVETSCFRVVQEAVTNCMRHARAKNLRIELKGHAGRLDLSIRDDGVGFDVGAARRRAMEGTSIGLLGMEERVELLGGQFEIESAPGLGTLIRATLPVPDEGDATREKDAAGGEPE